MRTGSRTPLALLACTLLAVLAPVAAAQSPGVLRAFARPITIDLEENRLEDVVEFIRSYTGAEMDVMWRDDTHDQGLDKDAPVTISVNNVSVLSFLERVLEKTQDDFDTNTWQVSDDGVLQIGPRTRLNAYNRLVAYDVQDLLYEIPNFVDTPALDLDQILQQSGQSGGTGGSIFSDTDSGPGVGRTEAEIADEITELIITNIEPEQWDENGGEGASIRFYRGTFLIRAPNYIHRQLGDRGAGRVTTRRVAPAGASAGSPGGATRHERAHRAAQEYRRARMPASGGSGR